jgi:hypothetical protein
MAEYQLTAGDTIVRTKDGACIPNDPANRDYAEYQKWLEDGGVPDPYVPPEQVAPTPTTQQEIMYDHENRIRALEGQAPLTIGDLLDKIKG